MASIFAKIIKGEIPSYKIYEDDKVFAFLDIEPVAPGHTLVVPKKEIDYWIDVPENDYLHLQKIAQKIGRAIHKATDCRKVFQAVIGLEVPHFHLHLIPGNAISDLNFAHKKKLPTDQMKTIQNEIVRQL